jgi:hypothetical protein
MKYFWPSVKTPARNYKRTRWLRKMGPSLFVPDGLKIRGKCDGETRILKLYL